VVTILLVGAVPAAVLEVVIVAVLASVVATLFEIAVADIYGCCCYHYRSLVCYI